MRHRLAAALTLALLAAALFLGAQTGSARPVPTHAKGFFGISPQAEVTPQEAEFMAAGGIESVRLPMVWASIQPTAKSTYDWSSFDPQFEVAVRAGLEVLPVLGTPPRWVTRKPTTMPIDNARQRNAWSAFLRAAVKRYGPGGEFWTEHATEGINYEPAIAKPVPIRTWQVWNESNFFYFAYPVSVARYARLLTLSSQAIKSTVPGSKVILSGLFGRPTASGKRGMPAATFLEQLYRYPGIKSRFDGISLHPYAVDVETLEEIVEEFHQVTVDNHDRPALYITEMGWGSQNNFKHDAFEQGSNGQVKQLRGAYEYLLDNQRRLNLKQVYWFSWKDAKGLCDFCDSVGLFREGKRFKPKPSWRAFVALTGGSLPALTRLRDNAPLALLGVALIAAAALLLSYASGLTYFQDSWEFLMNRRDLTVDAVFQPHNEHIVVFPVLLQQALLRLFGMGAEMPGFVVLTAFLLATAALVFVYVRRRVGAWPALIAAAVLLFLGPAWQDLLWPFQIGFVGSALFGVAMLLALDEDDRRWDIAACVFLALSIGFSSLGVPFGVAAAVNVLGRGRERGWARAYVAVVPALLYAAWWAGWGHEAESHLSSHNVFASPGYVLEGLAASVDAALALATILGEAVGRSDWGLPLLIALVLLLAYAIFRGRRPGPGTWPVLAATAAFWFLAAFSTIPGREAWSSRYLYVGVLFLLLLAADLLKGVRLGRWATVAAVVLAAAVVGFNLQPLREGRDFFRKESRLTKADLGAIEIAARTVEPDFALPPEVSGTPFLNEIHAGEYLRAVDEYGSPAYTPAELARAPEADRAQADVVLANALPLGIETEAEPAPPAARCVEVAGGGSSPAPPLALHAGTTTVVLHDGPPGAIRLRRFAVEGYPLATEGIASGSTTALYVPADRAPQPWLLEIEAPQGASVCRS